MEVEQVSPDEWEAIVTAMKEAESAVVTRASSSSHSKPTPPAATTTTVSVLMGVKTAATSSGGTSPYAGGGGGGSGLSDYLAPGLDLIFVGDNPGISSSTRQHHYAHASNHFWPLLRDSGLVPQSFDCSQDHLINTHGIGLTCLCARPSKSSSELSEEELHDGFALLVAKLEHYRPRFICFNGKGIYEAITGKRCILGYQGDDAVVPGIGVFVIPSTSARVKAYSYQQKLNYINKLKQRMFPSSS
ncbi:G/T mismatch-specific thymine DNA glycosylase [Balamuthia mandrillaris]